ncbi:MAG: polysaccharide deacetylase [Ruminococcaceae bacterium]|nr:polysaccharide deacetylase [Oscillospiraceae bacterium]
MIRSCKRHNYFGGIVMRESYYKARKRIHYKRFFSRIFLLLFIIATVVLGIRFIISRVPSYDDSILGSAYLSLDMPVPTATPRPTPPPGYSERTSAYPAELVSIYNQYEVKTAYLTFDDGPTANITPQILDVLKEKGVQATFFTLGINVEKNPELARRTVSEGHVLANHSYSHDYKMLYNGTEHFVEDVQKTEQVIIDTVGAEGFVKVFRFPGGSFEKSKDPQKDALSGMGYVFLDWNALNGDAEGHNIPPETQLEKIKSSTKGVTNAVILMHDAATKQTTVDALPAIIDYLQSEGFVFKTLKDAPSA